MVRQARQEEFEAIYAIMERSFPTEEYRRRKEQEELLGDERYTLWCYEEEGVVIGFAAVWELERFWFLEHLAVEPVCRGKGVGGLLLDALVARSPGRVILEVEPPETHLARRRVDFYTRHGFCINEYPYRQPSISRGKPDIPLQVMSYPSPLDEETFRQTKKQLYRIVYRLE